jgi:glycosyltransferase involved in cell wall biosynthesis
MKSRSTIVLIGNYRPDHHESMSRFALMLRKGFEARGLKVKLWHPAVLFGLGRRDTSSGFAKWLGYIDKWGVYPLLLLFKSNYLRFGNGRVYYHICDHSNSFYLKFLPSPATGITCHDVLAIRGAMGFKDTYCPATPFGKIMQKHILQNLSTAQKLAAVSNMTLKQLNEIAVTPESVKRNNHDPVNRKWGVVYNAFNAPFKPRDKSAGRLQLQAAGIDTSKPYLLHVGSSAKRKNRPLLVLLLDALGSQWSGNAVFAGDSIDEELKTFIESKGLSGRVISVVKPPHDLLETLYNNCYAFIFPSYSEGFGWPVIEAQACGAPVIASNIEPMPEICGNAALFAHPDDPQAFARALINLENHPVRENLVAAGFENCKRFSEDRMTEAYLRLHDISPTD